MLNTLLGLLESYGYPIVLIAATLENTFVVGMLVPGQVIILAAALATRFSSLNPFYVAGLAAAGEIIGNAISITVGRKAGPQLLDKWSPWFSRHGTDIEKAREFVQRRGAMAIVLGRPAWGLKNIIPAVVGASEMSPIRAMGYVTTASVIYYPLLVGVGWLLGLGVDQLARDATWFGIGITGLFVIVIAIFIWRARKRFDNAQRAPRE